MFREEKHILGRGLAGLGGSQVFLSRVKKSLRVEVPLLGFSLTPLSFCLLWSRAPGQAHSDALPLAGWLAELVQVPFHL